MKVLQRQYFALRAWGLLTTVIVAILGSGCSSFNRDWNRAAKQATQEDSIAGRWEGRWISDVNHHNGNLKCLMTVTNDSACVARFRATYKHVFHFSYAVPMNLQKHFDGWEFDGQENLGALAGGVYYYEGRANTTNFYSTYRSKYDHGIFELRRVR